MHVISHRTCYTDASVRRETRRAQPGPLRRASCGPPCRRGCRLTTARRPRSTRSSVAFDALDEPFSREHDPVHVTGSGFVVGPRGVVLLKHKRLGFWMQPGGHIDRGRDAVGGGQAGVWSRRPASMCGSLGPFDEQVIPELVHVDVHAGGRGHTHLDLRYLFDGRAEAVARRT